MPSRQVPIDWNESSSGVNFTNVLGADFFHNILTSKNIISKCKKKRKTYYGTESVRCFREWSPFPIVVGLHFSGWEGLMLKQYHKLVETFHIVSECKTAVYFS